MSLDLVKQTAEIVKAYASINQVSPAEVVDLMRQVHGTLAQLAGEQPAAAVESDAAPAASAGTMAVRAAAPRAEKKAPVRLEPAVPVDEAVQDDQVFCLLCGKGCQALKGHLTRSHKMELDEYRKTFGLPRDFPMVAKAYSERRRQLAIDANLAEKLQQARRSKSAKAS